jgi:hypothetical protein
MTTSERWPAHSGATAIVLGLDIGTVNSERHVRLVAFAADRQTAGVCYAVLADGFRPKIYSVDQWTHCADENPRIATRIYYNSQGETMEHAGAENEYRLGQGARMAQMFKLPFLRKSPLDARGDDLNNLPENLAGLNPKKVVRKSLRRALVRTTDQPRLIDDGLHDDGAARLPGKSFINETSTHCS